MKQWSLLYSDLYKYIPVLIAAAVITGIIIFANWFLLRRRVNMGAEAQFPRQIIMMLLVVAGFLLIILLFPMSETTRGQILSLIGIVVSAVIALSSTTFVANVMAGLMLRVIKSFRPGDFIKIGNNFGRVTERGLMHTEIQTQDRDLTTFPNLYLMTNPVTVVRSSGTIISAELSLGYDVEHNKVEELLKQAALEVKLKDPFVQIKELGNFSISYRIAGFLSDVKLLLSVKSDLREHIIDVLHANGIEIVSPTFMNQRQMPYDAKVVPETTYSKKVETKTDKEEAPENIMFDKAEEAEKIEKTHDRYERLQKELEELKKAKKSADKKENEKLDEKISRIEAYLKKLEEKMEEAEKAAKD